VDFLSRLTLRTKALLTGYSISIYRGFSPTLLSLPYSLGPQPDICEAFSSAGHLVSRRAQLQQKAFPAMTKRPTLKRTPLLITIPLTLQAETRL
jgi:hypothetical protein